MPPKSRTIHPVALALIAGAVFTTSTVQGQVPQVQRPGAGAAPAVQSTAPGAAGLAGSIPSALPGASAIPTARAGAAAPVGRETQVLSVRSRQIELHYRLGGGGPDGRVELWFTRDRGATWQAYGKDEDGQSPVVFDAPSEGLYGFTLLAHSGGQAARPAPAAYEPPQRWVFIDATPPLAQWNGVEPAESFASTRVLQLRWTAHDDNLTARPVSLAYQSSHDQSWNEIESAVANTGAYDWRMPESVGGAVSFKLIVRDQGGHAVERTFGPLAMDRLATKFAPTSGQSDPAAGASAPVKRPEAMELLELPGATSASQPAAMPRVDLLKKRMAADLYRQGSWHLVRGQYAVAAERLREALENDPDLLEARQDLAGIFYRQQDYDRAIAEYQTVISRNANYESALYGAALAYVAKRDYHQSREMLTRLLKVNDHNAEAWLDLGDVTFMMGDVLNARANWRRALKIDNAAADLVSKAQRRLELYGAADELSSTKQENAER